MMQIRLQGTSILLLPIPFYTDIPIAATTNATIAVRGVVDVDFNTTRDDTTISAIASPSTADVSYSTANSLLIRSTSLSTDKK